MTAAINLPSPKQKRMDPGAPYTESKGITKIKSYAFNEEKQ